MQKKFLLLITALAALLLAGCTNPILPEEVPGTDNNATGTVRFSWADAGQAGSRSRATLQDAAKVVITIEAADGTVVYDQKQLNLFNFNGSFISEPLALKVGNYRLTDYLILDSTGTVIYAAPKAGSNQAHLVTAPLPLDFTVTKNGTTKIKPEVVNTDTVNTTPADYGYWTFQFSEVKIFNFITSVMIYDASTDGFMPTDATLDVTVDTKSNSFSLAAGTNRIALNDVAGSYSLTFTKASYDDHLVTYSNAEMKAFFQAPLTVVLNKKVNKLLTFADPGLEAAVRTAIAKPTGDIYSVDVEGLTTLDAKYRTISSLAGIEELTALTELDLNNNPISDMGPLSSLTKLNKLSLGTNNTTDLTPIGSLTELSYLAVNHNKVTDISALASLKNLTILDIRNNNITEITALRTLPKLTHISLDHNNVTDLTPFAAMTNLKVLSLMQNGITDVSALANLTNLTLLSLQGNAVTEISSLSALTGLTTFNLTDCTVSNISAISAMTKLQLLYLTNNSINDITPLTALTFLNTLYLNGNNISDISPLVNNAGIGNGDIVHLGMTPLSTDARNVQVPALQARGVTVYF